MGSIPWCLHMNHFRSKQGEAKPNESVSSLNTPICSNLEPKKYYLTSHNIITQRISVSAFDSKVLSSILLKSLSLSSILRFHMKVPTTNNQIKFLQNHPPSDKHNLLTSKKAFVKRTHSKLSILFIPVILAIHPEQYTVATSGNAAATTSPYLSKGHKVTRTATGIGKNRMVMDISKIRQRRLSGNDSKGDHPLSVVSAGSTGVDTRGGGLSDIGTKRHHHGKTKVQDDESKFTASAALPTAVTTTGLASSAASTVVITDSSSLPIRSKIRNAIFPVHGKQEVTKFLLIGSIKFFVILALTLTRDNKDTMVVTECGAEAIAFLKVSFCYEFLP